jgi:ribosome-binding factor A
MTNHRIARISEELKRELSQMIREEIKDPRVKGLISITRADVTNDLRYAKVYVSVLSQEEQHSDTLLGLEKASGYLRSELAQRLQLRYTPELIFKLDDSIAYGTKINKIISGFKNEESKGDSDV